MTAAHEQTPSLAEAMAAHGMTPPEHIEAGRLVRFPGAGKRSSNKAGWCWVFPDGDGASFGDWSTGLQETWQARKPTNEADRRRWQKQTEQARKAAEAERAKTHQAAADRAADTWAKAGPADPLHGYLVSKGVQAHDLRQDGARLLIPLINSDGEIRSLQRIDTHGKKRFFPGGEVAGNYFLIGDPADTIVIAEGFATAASIHETTRHPVAVAFNAGNLEPVAKVVRNRHPNAHLILAADDDSNTPGNPGLSKATAAATAVNGEVVTPGQSGDFNDLHAAQGADAIRARFDKPRVNFELPLVNLIGIADLHIDPIPEIVERILPATVCTILAAHGGAGKTMLALELAASVVTGREFMGLHVTQCPVTFYSAEDDGRIVMLRLQRIMRAWHIDPDAIANNLQLIDATGIDPALFRESNIKDEIGTSRRGITTAAYDALLTACKANGSRLLIVDNASDVFEANENERQRVRQFVRSLARIARDIDGAVLLLSHVDKNTAKAGGSSEGYSGSTAWHNSARSRMFLSGDNGLLKLEHQKANHGPRADDIPLSWVDGLIQPGHQADPGKAAADGLIEARNATTLLQMIHDRSERGQFISTSPTAGNAWTTLKALDGFPKIDKRQFWRLIDKAETAGRLQREAYQDAKRMYKERFTVTAAGLDCCRMIAAEIDQ